MPWTYWNGNYAVSPSMRREWIEMECTCLATVLEPVSLHAEGVD